MTSDEAKKVGRRPLSWRCVAVAAAASAAMAACQSSSAQPSSASTGGANPGNPANPTVNGGTGAALEADGAADEPVTCEALASRVCAGFDACDPYGFALAYATSDQCLSHMQGLCDTLDQQQRPLDKAACVRVLAMPNCDAFAGRAVAAPCRLPPGKAAAGSKCLFDSDCSTLYCDVKAACGQCVERRTAGQPCSDGVPCDFGLVCAGTTCQPGVAVGGDCADRPCGGLVKCENNVCTNGLAENAACSPGAGSDPCDTSEGLVCDATLAACRRATTISPGPGCANVAPGSARLADGGYPCTSSAALGQPCNSLGDCLQPAYCVQGSCSALPPTTACK
jgi:hypothetical protein